MAKAYLVVRIKGQADVPYWANTTLNLLNLEKKYRAIITPASDSIDGMLKKIQHYVSWQEIDASTAKELLDKKGRKTGYKAARIPTLKEVHKGNHTYTYVKHSADTEFDSKPMWEVPEKLAEDEIASLKNIRQNIEQNRIGKNDIIGEHSISRTMLHGLFDDKGNALDDGEIK